MAEWQLTFTVTLPAPPSANKLFANSNKGRIKTAAYKAWLQEAALRVIPRPPAPIDPAHIEMRVQEAQPRDLDNHIKPVLDLLCMVGAIVDDRCPNVRSITAAWDQEVEGVEVTVRHD